MLILSFTSSTDICIAALVILAITSFSRLRFSLFYNSTTDRKLVLDIAKIESSRVALTYSEVDLQALFASVLEEVRPMAQEQGIQAHWRVEVGAESLETDGVRLHQILLNLVSNAVKFTTAGEVIVTSKQAAEGIAIAVQDTDIGISPEQHERLFEAFYQVEGGSTRRFGGTGLGLAIVRQLTTLLGGTIAVTSNEGAGSTFTLTLPRAVSESLSEPQQGEQKMLQIKLPRLLPTSTDLATLTGEVNAVDTLSAPDEIAKRTSGVILAVDDNADLLQLLSELLKNTPYTTVGVQDPLQVLSMVKELQPCAITLDVMMPRLNGWQILYQLRTDLQSINVHEGCIAIEQEP